MRRHHSLLFKISFIFIVLGWVYFHNQAMIQSVWQDTQLSRGEAINTIVQRLLDIQPRSTTPRQPNDFSAPVGSDQVPHQVNQTITQTATYQRAQEVATTFNQSLDSQALNQSYTQSVNQTREAKGWLPLVVGMQLEQGTWSRARELAQFHYLNSTTVDGLDFRTAHPNIWNADARLGESTFELYIAAEDIHLTTWQNPDILAQYIAQAFHKVQNSELSEHYQSQYVAVYAEPSEQQAGQTAYVRIVAVLTSDTIVE